MDTRTCVVPPVDSKPWIFLRGLTRESGHWGSFIAQFQATVPGSCVVALDLPGNGYLHRQKSPMNAHGMVESCRAQLRERQVAPPYPLLAMSLGAMVAVAWASNYPDEVSTLVLINTSLRPFSPFYERLLPANYGSLMELAVFGASPEAWEHTVLRLTSNHAGHHAVEAVLPLWLAWRQANPVSRSNALRQLVAAARFCAPQVRPAAATLVLASTQDRLVSAACSIALATHWRCALRCHPSAGHDLPLDDGPWVATQVKDWLVR
jgi:pimeloyl-ACP methyl ester carboxylesterase